MRRDKIMIMEYDPDWPELFEQQRQVLEQAFDGCFLRPIEHIGSTSVPGLPAKPIIDMLAVIEDYDKFADEIGRFAAIGWVLAPEPGEAEARKYSVCFPSIEHRSHHLHIVEPDWGWQDLLLYRDYLRAHPADAADYAELKRRVAAADDQDRPRYRAAKAPFIQHTLQAARRWRQ